MDKPLVSLLLILLSFVGYSQVVVSRQYIENQTNPMGVETTLPRFSWEMTSVKRNVKQVSFEIRVATSHQDLVKGKNLTWASGVVSSDRSVHVPYQGNALQSGERYYWQVRVTDSNGKTSAWSPVAWWQMALLDPEKEWTAQWIVPGFDEEAQRPCPVFRKEFTVQNKAITRATAYVTAHGMYEASINGQRIGDAYLSPGWTSYHNRLQYQVYDVTSLLVWGKNAVGATLGNGWYRGFLAWGDRNDHYGSDIALLFQLEIRYSDGSREVVGSEGSWKSATGPVVFSELYDGEIYDSRREMKGWSLPEYDDSGWVNAREMNFPKSVLVATENEPIRKHETFAPQDIFTTPSGDLVVDFGQNLVGWVQLTVTGQEGSQVDIYHSEVLDKNGNFYTDNLRDADQKNSYILNGEPNQVLSPHFTFQGFRYVKVAGFPGELKPENLTAIALYSDMEPTGEFSCSDPLLNQLQHNIQWGQKGNFLDVPTDCPQRDERLGWTGDAQAFFRTAAFNMNVNSFFSKWLKDVALDQSTEGSVPFVVPNVLGPNAGGSAGWADVATIIPWETYLLYGDKKVLETQYPSMKAWVAYIRSKSENNLWNTGFHFGDWLFYRPNDDNDGRSAVTDKYYITQCFYAYSTQLLINAAEVLGKTEDARQYRELLALIKQAFQHEFMSGSGRLGANTQTAYVLALHFDMLPEELRDSAAKRLVENVKSYGYHLTTGFLGTPYLCHVLSRFGYPDIAYELLMQDTYPSWLYPVTMGATTIWERWDGIKPDSSFQTPSMNSFNHYAYGAIGDWMYRNVAGINTYADGPGYQHLMIRPIPGGGLQHAGASLRTYYGTVRSGWAYKDGYFEQTVSVPVNTTASVFIPAHSVDQVSESGKSLASAGLRVQGTRDGYVQVEAGSGNYVFRVKQDPITRDNKFTGYEGVYNVIQGFSYQIRIESKGGRMYLIVEDSREEIEPVEGEPDVFQFSRSPENRLTFEKSRANIIRSIRIDADGLSYRASRQ